MSQELAGTLKCAFGYEVCMKISLQYMPGSSSDKRAWRGVDEEGVLVRVEFMRPRS